MAWQSLVQVHPSVNPEQNQSDSLGTIIVDRQDKMRWNWQVFLK
jgi:hypothetical protein